MKKVLLVLSLMLVLSSVSVFAEGFKGGNGYNGFCGQDLTIEERQEMHTDRLDEMLSEGIITQDEYDSFIAQIDECDGSQGLLQLRNNFNQGKRFGNSGQRQGNGKGCRN